MTTRAAQDKMREQSREEARRERLRAERAEDHLRDCRVMLRTIYARMQHLDCELFLGITAAAVEQMSERRVPATCSVKLSHYGTCKLGTHGCNERHEDEQPPVFGRLVLHAEEVES
jgi:hypothetical protein